MNTTILIIEDDADINQLLQTALRRNGYSTVSAYSGTEGILVHSKDISLIIMDLMLPGKSGQEIIQELKQKHNVPVIVTSAIHDTATKVDLFRLGADDYVTKPFQMDELLARIEVRLRTPLSGSCPVKNVKCRDIVLNPADYSGQCGGHELELSRHEFDLLLMLAENAGRICTKSAIFERVWDDENSADENTLNVHMSKIRQKLRQCNPDADYIETVWGIGYRLKK